MTLLTVNQLQQFQQPQQNLQQQPFPLRQQRKKIYQPVAQMFTLRFIRSVALLSGIVIHRIGFQKKIKSNILLISHAWVFNYYSYNIILSSLFFKSIKNQLEQFYCSAEEWSTKSCCESNAATCDESALRADGDQVFNEWYEVCSVISILNNFLFNFQAKGDCSSRANQLFNAPEKCVAKETMTNQQICGKIQWYCDDPSAQVLVRNIFIWKI